MICLITLKYDSTVQPFPCTATVSQFFENKVCDLESRLLLEFCSGHPEHACSTSLLRKRLSSLILVLSSKDPDLVSLLHIQVRLMGNLCLNGGIPWFFNTEGSVLYAKKTQKQYITTLLSVPLLCLGNYSSLWSNLKTKIINFNQTDGITMSDFITNLDPHKKVLLFLGGLSLPFDDASVVLRDLLSLPLVTFINCEQRSYVSLRHHGQLNNFCNSYYCKPF